MILTKKNRKRSSGGGHDFFFEIIGLSMFLTVYMFIMYVFESTISSITLFNIILTLGGLETYDATVAGTTILFLIFGLCFILADE
jgi:hypothetical protein